MGFEGNPFTALPSMAVPIGSYIVLYHVLLSPLTQVSEFFPPSILIFGE